jgi:Na+-transporting NADH:ubiquinone oxidoreductase subunit C
MASREGTGYTIFFAAAVCVVCAVLVSGTAVLLRPRQEANRLLDERGNVLVAAGLAEPGESLGREEIQRRFADRIRPLLVDLETGAALPDLDPGGFDLREARRDPLLSRAAPENPAKVQRLPLKGLVYQVLEDDRVVRIVLPVEGKGLWSTLYGFLALDADGVTVRGLTFYEHKETPGLGGEIDNPRWQARWQGRRVLDENGRPAITVVKGQAGPPASDPYQVDGLSGATMTSNGVTNLVRFWVGEDGYGPFLARVRDGEAL